MYKWLAPAIRTCTRGTGRDNRKVFYAFFCSIFSLFYTIASLTHCTASCVGVNLQGVHTSRIERQKPRKQSVMEKITNLRLLIPLLSESRCQRLLKSLLCLFDVADGWPQGAPEMVTGHDARSVRGGLLQARARSSLSASESRPCPPHLLPSSHAPAHFHAHNTAAQPPRARALYRARVA